MANDKTDYWGRISTENDKSFEKVQDELYYQHHYHPTYIPHYNTSASEDTEQAELDAQTESLGKQGKGETWVNGLPGRVSPESLINDAKIAVAVAGGQIGGGRVDWGCAAIVAVVVIAALVLIAIAGGL